MRMVSPLTTLRLGTIASCFAWSGGTRQIQSIPPLMSSAIWVLRSGMRRSSSLSMLGWPRGLSLK